MGLCRDVHCHLLPGVDDGARRLSQTQDMLAAMSEVGIREVTLTPHMNPEIYPDNTEAFIRERFEALTADISDHPEYPHLRLGGEYMVTHEFPQRDARELLQFLPGRVLIEMSYYFPSRGIEDAIFNITSSGLVPVLAHPERYLYLENTLRVYDRFRKMGCQFQLNILSFSGIYGSASVKIMKYLMKKDMYNYIGTDTHTLGHFQSLSELTLHRSYIPYVRALVENQNAIQGS